jgi:peptide/nickel transport system permease protein
MDTLDEEFVETGVIRGVGKFKVLLVLHASPITCTNVVLVSYMVGIMIGGTVVMEMIFSLPGIGRELIEAVSTRDYAIVQGIVMDLWI